MIFYVFGAALKLFYEFFLKQNRQKQNYLNLQNPAEKQDERRIRGFDLKKISKTEMEAVHKYASVLFFSCSARCQQLIHVQVFIEFAGNQRPALLRFVEVNFSTQ